MIQSKEVMERCIHAYDEDVKCQSLGIDERKEVLQNARIVSENGNVECPTLLFSSNGKQIDKYWIKSQQEFAKVMNAKLITFDCGHYIHYYKSNEMSKSIINFVNKL